MRRVWGWRSILTALFSQPPIFRLMPEESGKMSRWHSLCWRVPCDTEWEEKRGKLIWRSRERITSSLVSGYQTPVRWWPTFRHWHARLHTPLLVPWPWWTDPTIEMIDSADQKNYPPWVSILNKNRVFRVQDWIICRSTQREILAAWASLVLAFLKLGF